jgi:hypothetical protein
MTSTPPFHAVQHIRKLRGGSQSHLMRASDGNYYVVKFTNNAQCKRILANEFIGSRLGQMLGLPMPEARVIEVSEWLIQHTPELCIESVGMKIPCRPGQHLALRYAADPFTHNIFDYVPESLAPRIFNIKDFPRILVLDKWSCNCDGRQAVFAKRANYRYYHVTFIDQGYYFNAGEWTFPDLALHGVYYRNYVYQHVKSWNDFEPALSRAESMTTEQLTELADGIPVEWWAKQHTLELNCLFADLFQRRSKIRDLITDFRQSSRNPFPNWTDTPMVSVPAYPA